MSASSTPASPKEAPAKAGPPVAPSAVGSATSTAATSAAPPAASQPSVVAAPARIKPPPEYLTRPDGTAASPPDLPQIGTTAEGMPVYRSFQPSAGALAVMLTPFVRNTHSLEGALPLPAGLKLQRSPDRLGHQIQLRTAPLFAKKMRRTFGYVAEIKLTDGEGCGAPAQLQIVTRVPWRYGSTAAEKECSWTLIRIQAFTSKAMFATPARVGFCILSSPPLYCHLGRIHSRIQLGMVVQGFLEPSSGDTKSCQMVGWDVSTLGEWRMHNPHTVPANFDLNMDNIYCIPQLAGENFNYTRLPHLTHGIFSAAPIQGAFALPQDPSDETIGHLRNLALAQSRLHGMAPSAVAFAPPPPARGRSRGRSESARRAVSTPPAQPSELTRVPSGLGVNVSEVLWWGLGVSFLFCVRTFHQPRWFGRC